MTIETWAEGDVLTARALNEALADLLARAEALKTVLDARSSAAGPESAIVSRNSAGYFAALDPTGPSHVATRRYVDGMTWPASRIDSGILALARIPDIPYSKLADTPYHSRTTGVSVGLGGTTRTVTFPAGRFTSVPVAHVTVGNVTQASNVTKEALGTVTKDYLEYTLRNDGSSAQSVHVYISAFPGT